MVTGSDGCGHTDEDQEGNGSTGVGVSNAAPEKLRGLLLKLQEAKRVLSVTMLNKKNVNSE